MRGLVCAHAVALCLDLLKAWHDPERKQEAELLRREEEQTWRRTLYFPQVMRDARRIELLDDLQGQFSQLHLLQPKRVAQAGNDFAELCSKQMGYDGLLLHRRLNRLGRADEVHYPHDL